MDRGNLATRRNYVRRRKIGVWLVFLSFVLFLTAAFIIKDTSAPNGWMIRIDDQNHYQHGPLYGAYLLLCLAIIGMVLIFALMFLAFGNDIGRLIN